MSAISWNVETLGVVEWGKVRLILAGVYAVSLSGLECHFGLMADMVRVTSLMWVR